MKNKTFEKENRFILIEIRVVYDGEIQTKELFFNVPGEGFCNTSVPSLKRGIRNTIQNVSCFYFVRNLYEFFLARRKSFKLNGLSFSQFSNKIKFCMPLNSASLKPIYHPIMRRHFKTIFRN